MSFDSLGLSPDILRAVAEQGYREPTPIQQQAIPAVLEGRDLMASAQTGTGKTAGFTLPLLQHLITRQPHAKGRRPVRAPIPTPTRELAAQIGENVRKYSKYLNIRSLVVFGGVSINPLLLKDPATTKEAPQTLAQEVDRSVKSLDAKLTIPVDMATELMTQVAKLEGYQEDQAKKLAKQQVEGASAMGQMFRLTTLQDNTITTSLQYANGQITLNGQKMPLEDFVGMFAMPTLNVPAVPAIPQQ